MRCFWNVMMSRTGCENTLGGRSIGPNENISDERRAEKRKSAEGAGGVDLSVWPVITPPPGPLFVDVVSEMGGYQTPHRTDQDKLRTNWLRKSNRLYNAECCSHCQNSIICSHMMKSCTQNIINEKMPFLLFCKSISLRVGGLDWHYIQEKAPLIVDVEKQSAWPNCKSPWGWPQRMAQTISHIS